MAQAPLYPLLFGLLTAVAGGAAARQLPALSTASGSAPARVMALGEVDAPLPYPEEDRRVCWPTLAARAGACSWSARVGALHAGQAVHVTGAGLCDQAPYAHVELADGRRAWVPLQSLCD